MNSGTSVSMSTRTNFKVKRTIYSAKLPEMKDATLIVIRFVCIYAKH